MQAAGRRLTESWSNRAVEPTFGNKRERPTTVAEDREVEIGVHALSELVCRKEVDDGKAKRPGSILRSLGKNKNEESDDLLNPAPIRS
jgi:hypothetical protein